MAAGTAWTVTLNGVDFRYVAGLNGEMTVLPSIDVTVTDKDAPGVLVTQTGGSTRVTEPTGPVFLGAGQVTSTSGTSGYALTLSSANALTTDFSIDYGTAFNSTASQAKATFSGTQVWKSANIAFEGTVLT